MGHILDSDIFNIRHCYNWWLMYMTNGKTCEHVYYSIYVYSLYAKININYGDCMFLSCHACVSEWIHTL